MELDLKFPLETIIIALLLFNVLIAEKLDTSLETVPLLEIEETSNLNPDEILQT